MNAEILQVVCPDELIHVLCNAAHEPPKYNDFSTERADQDTLWSQPLVKRYSNEMILRDNYSIGATKRISIAQEAAAHSSLLAK